MISKNQKKTHTHNAKWLVPPFYVKNMNTEGGKINYVGQEKQIKGPVDSKKVIWNAKGNV